jgi:SAM-dependent methyltransferase
MSDVTGFVRFRTRIAYLTVRRVVSATVVDQPRGIETSRAANLGDLATPERVRYEPSGWGALRRILRAGEVSPEDVFVDLGCGKGRVVLAAARYPFRRVIGVEIAPELTAVARANVAASCDRVRCDIELVTMDVLDYQLPPDVTVVYLYNPFRGETFARFAAGLVAALDRQPRSFRLIYNTPMEHELLMQTGRFRVLREVRALRPGRQWARKLSIRMYAYEPIR